MLENMIPECQFFRFVHTMIGKASKTIHIPRMAASRASINKNAMDEIVNNIMPTIIKITQENVKLVRYIGQNFFK